jgi:hypothetical protein
MQVLTALSLASTILKTESMLGLEATIVNGMTGSIFQPKVNCPFPATDCKWGDFTTLGVCADFQSLTGQVPSNCTGDLLAQMRCEYSISKYLSVGMRFSKGNQLPSTTTTLSNTSAAWTSKGLSFVSIRAPNLVNGEGPKDLANDKPPPTEIFYSELYWCERKYHNVTASARETKFDSYEQEKAYFIEYEDDQFTQIYRTNSSNTNYRLKNGNLNPLWQQLSRLLDNRGVLHQRRPTAGAFDTELDIADHLRLANLTQVMQNVATSITNSLRHPDVGENRNSTMIHGTAFYDELYYFIRWGWITLPVALVLMVVVLFIVTMFLTRSEPLLKTSQPALLFYGLDGWSEEEIVGLMPNNESQEGFETAAEKLTATLCRNAESRLVFSRTK